jgi:uncharacterized protein YcfJ
MVRPVSSLLPGARTLSLAAALVTFAAAPAFADHHWRPVGDDDRPAGDDYDYARVVDVRPLVTRVRVDEPRRECWDETRYEAPPRRGVAGPMILGAMIGGALGNQIGRGDGRRAATVAGAIIGTALGHDAAERRRDRDYDPEPRPYTVQQCDVRYESRWNERIDGYDVTYEYHGRRYHTRLPYDPGDRIRVQVDVAPAEG